MKMKMFAKLILAATLLINPGFLLAASGSSNFPGSDEIDETIAGHGNERPAYGLSQSGGSGLIPGHGNERVLGDESLEFNLNVNGQDYICYPAQVN